MCVNESVTKTFNFKERLVNVKLKDIVGVKIMEKLLKSLKGAADTLAIHSANTCCSWWFYEKKVPKSLKKYKKH